MNTLTLASYNIQDGLYEEQINQNIRTMARDGVDIFCLQETRQFQEDFIVDKLKKTLGSQWTSESFLGTDNPRLELGLTLLWNTKRLTLQKFDKILFPKEDFVGMYDRIIRTIFPAMQRGALVGTFSINGHTVRITNLHLDMKNGPARRLQHVSYLADYLRTHPLQHEIVCGDFNTSVTTAFGKKQKKKIEKLLGNEFMDAMPDIPWTFDGRSVDTNKYYHHLHRYLIKAGFRLYRKLDYIFIKNMTIQKSERLLMGGSDHFPLVISLTLPE